MQTTTRPQPIDTPERWNRAIARATQSGIVPKQIATDRYAVKSASANVYYMVQASAKGISCTCKAAIEGDPICWHRAAACLAAQTARSAATTPKTAA